VTTVLLVDSNQYIPGPLVSALRYIGLPTWCGVQLANDIKGTFPLRTASEGPEARKHGIRRKCHATLNHREI
jgi:hypothetical protein